ncbi:ABC transporter ATP-binding protein [Polaribacter porphyrae]|uniref:Multidrug ABC transporter ATP-binding protein n=1 Tax=Polaribacter porphyrae TaxID=1137780 RepID=A0A2S7WK44_9FLAO|nr:ABC transporter ATP-binding protein [Polaribacter porphyrae]PQJ77978.1 multidrug ABC transporter ATP-binding protein [Polaribacter porphyrae]
MSLQINKLTKTYSNGVKAINNLDIEIKKGMFGLLGPNGAGKSSLMRTIATLQNPTSGSVIFNDIDVLKSPLELRKVLGYLPQYFGVYPKVSAEKLLDYFGVLKGISSKKERNKMTQSVLELTNLCDVRKKSVSGYSGGMKQRFGIAQLLLNNPKLIIVDEPTAGLDPAERNRFLNVLREVGTENTVIFSTHIVDDVKELCTDMAIMNGGEILQKTTPLEATNNIKDKIWETIIDKNKLPFFEEKFNILSSSFTENNALAVRVFAKEKPNDSFTIAKANLEDVYFIALKNANL